MGTQKREEQSFPRLSLPSYCRAELIFEEFARRNEIWGRGFNICKLWRFESIASWAQISISVLFPYSKHPERIIIFSSKQGLLALKTPQSTYMKGFPTVSLGRFLFAFHLFAVPQNVLSISISRNCLHSSLHLDAFLPADSDFTHVSWSSHIPSLPLFLHNTFLPSSDSVALSHRALKHHICFCITSSILICWYLVFPLKF